MTRFVQTFDCRTRKETGIVYLLADSSWLSGHPRPTTRALRNTKAGRRQNLVPWKILHWTQTKEDRLMLGKPVPQLVLGVQWDLAVQEVPRSRQRERCVTSTDSSGNNRVSGSSDMHVPSGPRAHYHPSLPAGQACPEKQHMGLRRCGVKQKCYSISSVCLCEGQCNKPHL